MTITRGEIWQTGRTTNRIRLCNRHIEQIARELMTCLRSLYHVRCENPGPCDPPAAQARHLATLTSG